MDNAGIPFWLVEHCNRLAAKDQRLTNLNLNIRRLDASMLDALAEALRDNHSLIVLNLTSSLMHNPLDIDRLALLVRQNHTSLQVVHLCYNRLEDISRLAEALAYNSKLTDLHMDYNLIHTKSAVTLSLALQKNTTLRVLKLNHNAIGDVGCCALAINALRNNTTLTELGLRHNQITDIGGKALLDALMTNTTIQSIDIEQNAISKEVAGNITITCRANAHGRKYLQDGMMPLWHWPHLLERVNHDAALVYFFLVSRPDLFFSDHCIEDTDDMSLTM
jgi:Leucine Rich repeat